MEVYASGWCCTDCIMLIANGETPPNLNEDETNEWLSEIDRRNDGFHIVPGGEHEDDCPNMENGQWIGATDCYCETIDFSWSQCDVCGSNLGGTRHAVTWFKREANSEVLF